MARTPRNTPTPEPAAATSQPDIEGLIADGEQAIADAAAAQQGRKRGRKSDAERAAAAESRAAKEARLVMMKMAFTVTGRVVFNDLLKLEPRFSDEAGAALADAWLPVLDTMVESPLGIALTVTGGICAPYAIQLVARMQAKSAERAQHGATGREIRAAS